MPEVRLQAGEIVEVHDDEVIRGVGRVLFVAGAMNHTLADASVSDGRNLSHRAPERLDEREPIGVRQISARLHQHDMGHHGDRILAAAYYVQPQTALVVVVGRFCRSLGLGSWSLVRPWALVLGRPWSLVLGG